MPKLFIVGSFSMPMSLWSWDENDGSFSYLQTIDDDGETTAPTWVCQSKCGKYIYCTNELPEGATVASYRLLWDNGVASVEFINRVPAGGGWPCHIALTDSVAIISNFKTGTVGFLPIDNNGALLHSVHTIDNNNSDLCSIAHAHEAVLSPDESVVYICDLGMDQIYSYGLNKPETGCLVNYYLIGTCHFASSSGPRHMVLHPNALYAYAITEFTSLIHILAIDPTTGSLSFTESPTRGISALRDGQSSEGMAGAEILLSDDGRYLYVSNRDVSNSTEDSSSIAVFIVLEDGKSIKLLQHVHSGGRHPRHMALVSGGEFLVVANKEAHNLATFSINQGSGLLCDLPHYVTQGNIIKDPSLLLELH